MNYQEKIQKFKNSKEKNSLTLRLLLPEVGRMKMVNKYSIIRKKHVLELLKGEINNSNDKNMLKARKILEYLSKNSEFISSEKIGTYMKNLDPLDISKIPKERKYWQKSYFDIINALIDVGLVERRKNARSFEYKLKTAFDKFDSVEAINFMKESLKNSGNYDQYSNTDTPTPSSEKKLKKFLKIL